MTLVKTPGFFPNILSRHPSHAPFRRNPDLKQKFRSVVRFGSTTEKDDVAVQINTTEAIRNSANKFLMKQCFTQYNVPTCVWGTIDADRSVINWVNNEGGKPEESFRDTRSSDEKSLSYPVVVKHIYGSRGEGNYLLHSPEELEKFVEEAKKKGRLQNYIVEKFFNGAREYRLHVTRQGCFYTCEKKLKKDTPQEDKWFRNDKNCVWFVKDNPDFDMPQNWNEIEEACVLALNAVGLDFGACDVRVQGPVDPKGNPRTRRDFKIIEINSAPSMGDGTYAHYMKKLPELLQEKYELLNRK